MSKKTTLIFDFFGVISSEVADFWFKKYIPDRPIAEIRDSYISHADAGRMSIIEVYKVLADMSAQSQSDVQKQWEERAIIDKAMVDLIRELKSNYKIVLCSNAAADYLRPVLVRNDLEELFDEIVISGEVGLVKPDKEIFDLTLNRIGSLPEESVFIDDSEENIAAARSYGIESILFTSVQQLQEALQS